jgi:hypothetical protein
MATCKCNQLPGNYLLGLGLNNGAVQIWQIQITQWGEKKLLETIFHDAKYSIKEITFIDEYRIVSGSSDKTIKLLTFSHDGHIEDVKEFKLILRCKGMKIDGVKREEIEGKKLQKLINNSEQAI